ncbi:prolyl oligopeptidase family serine peptidase [Salinivibrio sp. SS2]|uniref:prolyl oligopeptidase family serine peptidase n=1 Tax=Salinivibrio sp. SS2 TaxID=1892894 RepID=UPI00084BCAB2|nr:prolyl oligopeptidase family serine peptidase [Salinivibrio sp. DV]ODQ01741.1 hypothetical protein BGK46_15890 [Salinivibrio sp. DV]
MKLVNALLIGLMFVSPLSHSDDETSTLSSFSWLQNVTQQQDKIRTYLERQNQHAQQSLMASQSLRDELLSEWARTPQTGSEPWLARDGREFLQTRVNGERVLSVRKAVSEQEAVREKEAGSEKASTLLNIEARAAEHVYYQLGTWSLSPNGQWLAIAEDNHGEEDYRIVLINRQSGQADIIATGADASVIWSPNNQQLYYVGKEAKTARPSQLFRHEIGTTGGDSLVYEEVDPAWLLSVYRASHTDTAIVQVNNESSTEQRLLRLNDGSLSAPLKARQPDVEYYLDKTDDALWMLSNHQGTKQFYRTAVATPNDWHVVYAAEPGAELNTFYLFEDGIVLTQQYEGEQWFILLNTDGERVVKQPLAAQGQVAWFARGGDYASNQLFIRSMSLVQPPRWEALDLKSGTRREVSADHYPDFDASRYHSERLYVGPHRIPVTLAYRKDALTPSSPVVLYGYGAYGFTMKPYFMPQTVSLMDRGVIYAIAHVRGGGYYGATWHQAGSGMNKKHGIQDFIDVAKAMGRYQDGQRAVAAVGSSAGGTLIAAALNQAPAAFAAASLNVPFVDVLGSMANPALPLTAQQYQEWGNPAQSDQREVMQGYDPLRNIQQKPYPPMLVRVGWDDQRVPFWEGAQYLSHLAATSTRSGPYLLLTDFSRGHQADARHGLTQQATDYAFLLHQLKRVN